ncbi:MAG: hypothetical protein V3T83_16575 [Acidobacteriota bacterium]
MRRKRRLIASRILFLAAVMAATGYLQAQSLRLDWIPRIDSTYRFRALEQLVLEIEFEFQQRELVRRQKEEQRRLKIRRQATQLAEAAAQLEERLSDPRHFYADTPKLLKKCEKLSKSLRKLLGIRHQKRPR